MSFRNHTTQEKLSLVESLIRGASGGDASVLKAIASDLRSRLAGAPSAVLFDIERRANVVAQSKTTHGYDKHALHGLGEGIMVNWPTIKQALERFAVLESAE